MADIAQLAIKVDSTGVNRATSDLNRMDSASMKAAKAANNLTVAGKNNSFQMRQTAMQLSQVASQGAVTGNYLQALAIQLPDLALAFGPVAIIAGALAGSLAGPMIDALSGTSRSIDDLKDSVNSLNGVFDEASDGTFRFSEELVRLAKVSEEAARLQITVDISEARKNINEVRAAMAEVIGGEFLSGFGSADIAESGMFSDTVAQLIASVARNTGLAREEIYELARAFDETKNSADPENYSNLASIIDDLKNKYGESNESVNELASGMSGLIVTGTDAAIALERLTEAGSNFDELMTRSELGTQNLSAIGGAVAEQMRMIEDAIKNTDAAFREFAEDDNLFKAAQSKIQSMMSQDLMATLSPEQRAAQVLGETMREYQSLLDQKLISDEQYLAAKELAEERYYARIKELRDADQQAQIGFNQETVSAFGSMIGNLTQIAAMGGEEQFDTWKRLAQAQAGVSAAMAVLSVLGDPSVPAPLKPFVIGTFGALAAAQIAQIENTEYRAREYGGQVSAGTSYLVGERGPEVITMGGDGMVTPNSKLGGDSNTYVFNVSTGVQSTVRAEMMSLMPTIVKTAQQVSAAQARKR